MAYIIDFNPVAIKIGYFSIHWYGLAYSFSLLLGLHLIKLIDKKSKNLALSDAQFDLLFLYIIIGIIFGGRLGYVLIYNPLKYFHEPEKIYQIWNGGMSFHGGALGCWLATYLFCRKRLIPHLKMTDMMAIVAPVGLFLGRIANFINGELYGRPGHSILGNFIFPHAGSTPRHPSQLYEAFTEGLVLGAIMWLIYKKADLLHEKPGRITAIFAIGYSLARASCEFYRAPDKQIGYIFYGVTMGHILSFILFAIGLALWLRAKTINE